MNKILLIIFTCLNLSINSSEIINSNYLAPRSILSISEFLNFIVTNNVPINYNSNEYKLLKDLIRVKFSTFLNSISLINPSIYLPILQIGAYKEPQLVEKLRIAIENQSLKLPIDIVTANVWPRDEHTNIGGRKIERELSEIGEGGAFVWSNKDRFILASSNAPKIIRRPTEEETEIYKNKILNFANEIGYKVYFIKPEGLYSHIDTSVGIIDKYKIILITPSEIQYNNKKVLQEIAENEGYKIIETSHANFNKCPSNIINIGSEFYLFNDSQETIDDIINALSNEYSKEELQKYFINIPLETVRLLSDFGIRCMSNIDYPILYELLTNKSFSNSEIEAFILSYELFLNNFMNTTKTDELLTDDFIDNLTNELLLKTILNNEFPNASKNFHLKTLLDNFKVIKNEGGIKRLAQLLTNVNKFDHQPSNFKPEQSST